MKTIQYILPVLLVFIMAGCTKIKCAPASAVPPGKYTIQRIEASKPVVLVANK